MALSLIMGVLAIKVGLVCAPFLLVAGLVLLLAACFAIAYDDVVNFLAGNDSVIGRLSKDYPWIGELVRDIVDVLALLWDVAKAVGTMLVECISDPSQAFENFQAKIGPLIDSFTKKFPVLGNAIKDVGTIIKWLWDMAKPLLKGLLGLIKDVLGFIVDGITKIGGILGKALSWAAKKIRGEEEDGLSNMDTLLEEKSKQDEARPPQPEKDEDDLDDLEAYLTETPRGGRSSPLPAPGHEQSAEAAPPAEAAPRPVRETPQGAALPYTPPRDGSRRPRLPESAAVPPLQPGPKTQPLQQAAGVAPLAGAAPPQDSIHGVEVNVTVLPPGYASLPTAVAAEDAPPTPLAGATPPMPSPCRMPPEVAENINRGQKALAQTNIPLSAMPGGMQKKTENTNKTVNVTVGKVEIITQAMDAEGISKGLGSALEDQLRAAVNNFDDGVRA